ncbi:MAG: HD domain-containing phosphohydrolase, partial [Gemmatimonadota bacterium]
EVVITDIRLPGASGNELVAAVKSRWPTTQVIVITGFRDAQFAAEALNAGADGYLFKPFGMPELRTHLLEAIARRDRILTDRDERHLLTHEARERADEAREAILKGALALVRAVEVRDPYTRGHSARVAAYAVALAIELEKEGTFLDLDTLRLASELHDVGKIGIPDAILNKESSLSGDEFLEIEYHPRTGRRILEPLLDDEIVLAVASWHHERWDGGGYPDGLTGSAIPLAARVVGLADALDAMTSDRAYRAARPWEDAVEQIRGEFGAQFDPGLLSVFEAALPRLHEVYRDGTARRESSV